MVIDDRALNEPPTDSLSEEDTGAFTAEKQDEQRWGTIFMGPTSDRESRMDKFRNRRDMELWNRQTEAEYMERVREKAFRHARAVIRKAEGYAQQIRQDAEHWVEEQRQHGETLRVQAENELTESRAIHSEVEELRQKAHELGYAEGMEKAVREFEEHCAHVDATTLDVLKTIEAQTSNLFQSWKAELVELLRTSVEMGLHWVLTEDRAAALGSLLSDAVQQLEDRRRIVIRAHPEDALAIEEVLGSTQRRFNELQSWEVIPDASLTVGSLVVESLSGVIESQVETRYAAVRQALEHLMLPVTEKEDVARTEVKHALQSAGVNHLVNALSDYEEKQETRLATAHEKNVFSALEQRQDTLSESLNTEFISTALSESVDENVHKGVDAEASAVSFEQIGDRASPDVAVADMDETVSAVPVDDVAVVERDELSVVVPTDDSAEHKDIVALEETSKEPVGMTQNASLQESRVTSFVGDEAPADADSSVIGDPVTDLAADVSTIEINTPVAETEDVPSVANVVAELPAMDAGTENMMTPLSVEQTDQTSSAPAPPSRPAWATEDDGELLMEVPSLSATEQARLDETAARKAALEEALLAAGGQTS